MPESSLPRIGCDLVDVAAFARSLERPGFRERVFHESEIAYCEGRASRLASYAVRFAAKEAAAKALGTGFFQQGITPQDAWVEPTEEGRGRPLLRLSEKAWELMRANGHRHADVSLSHTDSVALAVVQLC